MEQTQRHLVSGLVVVTGGLIVMMAAIERLSSPTLRALGEREMRIMGGLLLVGLALMIRGACEAAGISFLPDIVPSILVCLGAMYAAVDVARIYLDTLRWLGSAPGPLAAVPSSNNWLLLFGALVSGGGGVLMAIAAEQTNRSPDRSSTSAGDVAKTYHANRWWMRDGEGSVLIWDDQAQAWSPWVEGKDPALPPGWSEASSRDVQVVQSAGDGESL